MRCRGLIDTEKEEIILCICNYFRPKSKDRHQFKSPTCQSRQYTIKYGVIIIISYPRFKRIYICLHIMLCVPNNLWAIIEHVGPMSDVVASSTCCY